VLSWTDRSFREEGFRVYTKKPGLPDPILTTTERDVSTAILEMPLDARLPLYVRAWNWYGESEPTETVFPPE
jgi:hypothetical protein